MLQDAVNTVHDSIEQPVHQLWLFHIGEVLHDLLSTPGHPTGFCVCASSARKYQDAGIGPLQCVKIGLELTLGLRVVRTFGVLVETLGKSVFVDVASEPIDEKRIQNICKPCSNLVSRNWAGKFAM